VANRNQLYGGYKIPAGRQSNSGRTSFRTRLAKAKILLAKPPEHPGLEEVLVLVPVNLAALLRRRHQEPAKVLAVLRCSAALIDPGDLSDY